MKLYYDKIRQRKAEFEKLASSAIDGQKVEDWFSIENPTGAEKFLLELGLVPVRKEDGSSMLGYGVQGAVYNVLHKGRPAAAKLVRSGSKEGEITKKILAMLNSLPKTDTIDGEELPIKAIADKVFKKVYKVVENYKNYDVIVTELLEEVPQNIKRRWRGLKRYDDRDISLSYENKVKYLKALILRFIEFEIRTHITPQNKKALYDIFFNSLSPALFKKINYNEAKANLRQEFKNKFPQIFHNEFPEPYFFDDDIDFKFKAAIRFGEEERDIFPRDFQDLKEDSKWQHRPESENILKVLKYMHDNYGLVYGDLHSSNVMLRPETRDIVISDIGYFRFAKQASPFKQNLDYESNFLDKLRKRLKEKRRQNRPSRRSKVGDHPAAMMVSPEAAEGEVSEQQEYRSPDSDPERFDRGTDKALRDFQRNNNLIEDGIAGEWTMGKLKGEIPKEIVEPNLPLFHQRMNISPLAAKIGISPIFLKAFLDVSKAEPDLFLYAWFRQTPQAIQAANDLSFTLFAELYFGEYFLSEGIDEELKIAYNKESKQNPEFGG